MNSNQDYAYIKLKSQLEKIKELEKQIKFNTDLSWKNLAVILNGDTTQNKYEGVIKMPKIILAHTYPKLKEGDKIEVLTNQDHKLLGNYSQTSAWSTTAESIYCHKQYTVTKEILQCLQNKDNIRMDKFPELADKNSGWVIHYADFKMATIQEIVQVPMYQILKVNKEKISNILLTPDKSQAEELLKSITKANTNPETHFTQIEFTLKKKIEKEYE